MNLSKTNPTTTKAWAALALNFKETQQLHLKELFAANPNRAKEFTIAWDKFLVDYSKNRISEKTLELLVQLANEMELKEAIGSYFNGERINQTEGRAVLHTALRTKETDAVLMGEKNVVPEVFAVKEHIKQFTAAIVSGEKRGYTGKAFTTVVNIGIGGSDLGPAMVVEALKFYKNHLKTYFVSNVDGDHVQEILKELDPETTLFVVVSKTFTTQEKPLAMQPQLKNGFYSMEHRKILQNTLLQFPPIQQKSRSLVLLVKMYFPCGIGLAGDFRFGVPWVLP